MILYATQLTKFLSVILLGGLHKRVYITHCILVLTAVTKMFYLIVFTERNDLCVMHRRTQTDAVMEKSKRNRL